LGASASAAAAAVWAWASDASNTTNRKEKGQLLETAYTEMMLSIEGGMAALLKRTQGIINMATASVVSGASPVHTDGHSPSGLGFGPNDGGDNRTSSDDHDDHVRGDALGTGGNAGVVVAANILFTVVKYTFVSAGFAQIFSVSRWVNVGASVLATAITTLADPHLLQNLRELSNPTEVGRSTMRQAIGAFEKLIRTRVLEGGITFQVVIRAANLAVSAALGTVWSLLERGGLFAVTINQRSPLLQFSGAAGELQDASLDGQIPKGGLPDASLNGQFLIPATLMVAVVSGICAAYRHQRKYVLRTIREDILADTNNTTRVPHAGIRDDLHIGSEVLVMPVLGMTLVLYAQRMFEKTRNSMHDSLLGSIPWTKGVTLVFAANTDQETRVRMQLIEHRAARAVPMILHSSSLALVVAPFLNTKMFLPVLRGMKNNLTWTTVGVVSLGSVSSLAYYMQDHFPKNQEAHLAFTAMMETSSAQNFVVFPAWMIAAAVVGDAMAQMFLTQ
jgi:hypothetical protein